MTDHTTNPTPAPDTTCHAWRPWGDAELSCALAAGHQGHHDDGEGRTWTDAQAEQEARDDDSGETPIPGTGYRWRATDPTPTADPARLDLDEIEREYLRQCGPCDFALINMGCNCPSGDPRAAISRLVARVRQLETELADTRADRNRLNDELNRWIDANEAACLAIPIEPKLTSRPLPEAIRELARQRDTARRDGAADALDAFAARLSALGRVGAEARDAQTWAAEVRAGARIIPTTTAEETL